MAQPTVIASFGGGTSNSYADLAYANTYMDTKVNRDAWDDATPAKHGAALIEATRQIDARRWRGSRYYSFQNLEFPRTMYSEEATYPGETYAISQSLVSTPANIDWVRMESRVKDACCEQALHILDLGGSDSLSKLQRRGVRSYSESIGKISESYSFGAGYSAICPEAARLLSLYKQGKTIVRS